MGVIWEKGDGRSVVIVGGVAGKQRQPSSPARAEALAKKILPRATPTPFEIKAIAAAVLHIPHSSRLIPKPERAGILLSDTELHTELIRMTDSYTDELFDCSADLAERVVFPVSRLIVDPERFTNDADEPMSARGMGVVYELTSHGARLRAPVDTGRRQLLIETYYQPHHHRLRSAVAQALERWDKCLVLDCHSFPSEPLPYELDQSPGRSQICIGTDTFHTPETLAHQAEQLFAEAGLTVARNAPFAGALVPTPYYGRDDRVVALMVEVNRSLYMNEVDGERLPSISLISTKIQRAVQSLIQWTWLRPY